jgi:hypothetical protein
MAVPNFLNSSFRYFEKLAVADVATIISDFRDEVLNHNDPAWTEPSANNFKSPPAADGQFFTVVLTAVSTTRLGFKILDIAGSTICDLCIDIEATVGNAVQYYTGQFHAFINSARGTPECAGGGILDMEPETMSLALYRTFGGAHRNSAGTVTNNQSSYWYMWSDTAAAVAARSDVGNGQSGQNCNKTCAAVYVYSPVMIKTSIYGSGNDRWIGRIFQTLRCSDDLSFGSEVTVPIDTGATGVFKVVGRASSYGSRICVRKS